MPGRSERAGNCGDFRIGEIAIAIQPKRLPGRAGDQATFDHILDRPIGVREGDHGHTASDRLGRFDLAPAAVVPPKSAALRALGPGVFKCEDSNGAVTYSQYPCDDGKMVDTRPTSGGFSDQWSISVKRAE